MLVKLHQTVTELHLVEASRKHDRLWRRAEQPMASLGIQPSLVEHIRDERNPEVFATKTRMWLLAAIRSQASEWPEHHPETVRKDRFLSLQ